MIVVAKLRRTHHLSLQVFLVTVKSVILLNEEYSVFGNLCKKADGDNDCYAVDLDIYGSN